MLNTESNNRLTVIEKGITVVEKTIRRYRLAAFISIIIACILLIIFWSVFYFGAKKEYQYLLDIGAISGGLVSSLFSLSGLLFVYVAFLGQKQQLLYQQIEMLYNKEELSLTRIELQNQQKEMKQQNDTLKLQNFENTFFQLLSNYQKNISLFYIIMDNNLFKNFVKYYQNYIPENRQNITKEDLCTVFQNAIKDNSNRHIEYTFLYQIKSIIKIIEKNKISKNEYYFDILRNVLSKDEKRCIYLILNYDENIDTEIKTLFDKYNILNGYKIETSYFIKGRMFF